MMRSADRRLKAFYEVFRCGVIRDFRMDRIKVIVEKAIVDFGLTKIVKLVLG
jgi:hypothetical protein